MQKWIKLPTWWIERDNKLKSFTWTGGKGLENTAALMCLIALAHQAHSNTGMVIVTYDQIHQATGLSRSTIAKGLTVLQNEGIIERYVSDRRSHYRVIGMGTVPWAMFPAAPLYDSSQQIEFLQDFNLRKQVELNALKLLFLFASRRDRESNYARLSYDKIVEFSGIERRKVRSAISLLVNLGLVHVDDIRSSDQTKHANAYRLSHLLPFIHRGTTKPERLEATPF